MSTPIADQAKSMRLSIFCFSLPVSIATYDLLSGTWILFVLWSNFIGWNLLPIARPMLVQPGSEIPFFPSQWRELMHVFVLLLFTFLYLIELVILLALIVMLFVLIGEVLKLFPPPLDALFNAFKI